MNKAAVWLLLLCTIRMLSSCSSSHRTTKEKGRKSDTTAIAVTQKGMNAGSNTLSPATRLLAQMLNERASFTMPFRTFSARARMHYEQEGDSKEFTAYLRIDSGKAVWVNITALGGMVNVGRALITPDSIRFVNYLQQEAIVMPFSESGRLLPVAVSFADLHAVLLGIAPAVSGNSTADVQVTSNEIRVFNSSTGKEQTHIFSSSDTVLQRYEMVRTGTLKDFTLQMNLADFTGSGGPFFSQKRTVQLQVNQKKSTVRMNLEDVHWNEAINMPFSIPKNYTIK